MLNDTTLLERSINDMPGRKNNRPGNSSSSKKDNRSKETPSNTPQKDSESKATPHNSPKASDFPATPPSQDGTANNSDAVPLLPPQAQQAAQIQPEPSPASQSPGRQLKWFDWTGRFIEAVAVGVMIAFLVKYAEVPSDIKVMKGDIDNIKTDIVDLDGDLSSIETNLNTEIIRVEDRIKEYVGLLVKSEIASQGNGSTLSSNYTPIGQLPNMLTRSYASIDDPIVTYDTLVSYDTLVIKNISDGRELTLREIVGKQILLPYTDENGDSIFYGQLSENGNWHGRCIVNTYKDGKLSLITDAQYVDGVLVTCNQIFPYQTDKEGDVWAVSNRTRLDGFSTGDTVYVKYTGDYLQTFDLDKATADNVLTAEGFAELILSDSSMVGFYHGNISNGRFNDDTGSAYLAKFFDDGTVRMLYKGRIKNGTIAASSDGNAWFIGKSEEDPGYSYTTGPFTAGKAPQENEYWTPISQTEIQKILYDNLIPQQWNWGVPST